MKEDLFLWLQQWYTVHIQSNLKYEKIIRIKTLDNPGWSLTINLKNTNFQNMFFKEIEIDHSENNWLFCQIKEGKFEGRCGPLNLIEVIQIFRHQVNSYQIQESYVIRKFMKNNTLDALQNWYFSQCDGDWEHCYGIKIETLEELGWSVGIILTETILEEKKFNNIDLKGDETNWIQCQVKDQKFQGLGGPQNLTDIINIFVDWKNN